MNWKSIALCFGILASLALLFSGTHPSYSCVWAYDYEKYRISYVDPDLLSDSIYQSFYRTILREHQAADNYEASPHLEFYDEAPLSTWEEENVADWQKYFGGGVSKRSIHDVVYSADPNLLDSAISLLERGKPCLMQDLIAPSGSAGDKPDTLFFAETFRAVSRRHDLPFLRYLTYARRCLPYDSSDDPWNARPTQTQDDSDLTLAGEGLRLYNATPSAFLKLRYGYQIVRLARYTGEYRKAMELYDRLVEPNPTRSPIRFQALGHKAGAARRAGDTAHSNYWFAQVFDSCDVNRASAVRDFTRGDAKEWDALYKLARNNHERSILRMLRGFKEKGLNFGYMREMYELESTSPQLEVALLRELHRIESYLYAEKETRDYIGPRPDSNGNAGRDSGTTITDEFREKSNAWRNFEPSPVPPGIWSNLVDGEYNRESHTYDTLRILSGGEYVSSFRRFVTEVADQGRVAEPALWYMVAGYIDMMDEDYDMADQCLDEARSSTRGNYELEHQIQLLDYLRRAKKEAKVGEDVESRLAETLRWFREKQGRNRHTKYDKVMAELGRQYLAQNDVPKAILAFSAAHDKLTRNILLDMYATEGDLRRLQEIVEIGGRTDYEHLLVDSFPLRGPDLLDLRGTRLMRQGNFRAALPLFRQIPSSYWDAEPKPEENGWQPPNCRRFYSSAEEYMSDGTNISAYMAGDDAPPKGSTRRYTKLSFAEKAVDLLEKGEREEKQADSIYYRLGLLLFNTCYWGYADGIWNGELLFSVRFYQFGPTIYPFNLPGVAESMARAQERFMEEYGPRRLAREYFLRAMNRTENRELAAECAYLIDLCANRPLTTLREPPPIEKRDRTGYTMLMTKYRDTYFAQHMLSVCSVYQYFGLSVF